ncbi:hypothetical protein FB567DRAFT_246206 [Paraphoma chrysanthemicola]|uniref:EthD domain-containing protein n=1 Tax=Paraphoma chrysanthemicola TaxID=798071 RepID=A0A8K0QUF5_9PLEO|nr:hypothetical protein FB567DRAFT_246206 [Paraphoma chrysanthemicola]
MAGATVIVTYPRKDGATFNKEYYLSTHMELCHKHWKKHGLKSWSVTELAEGPYSIASIITFESPEHFQAAVADPNTKLIMEDVPNFSSEPSSLLHGTVLGQGTV